MSRTLHRRQEIVAAHRQADILTVPRRSVATASTDIGLIRALVRRWRPARTVRCHPINGAALTADVVALAARHGAVSA